MDMDTLTFPLVGHAISESIIYDETDNDKENNTNNDKGRDMGTSPSPR